MITPGSLNPLMWGQADPLDEYGKIERSLRTRSSAAGNLSRTPAVSESDPRLWTISLWVKRSALSQVQTLIAAGNSDVTAPQETQLRFSSDGTNDVLQFIWNGNATSLGDSWTTAGELFRDTTSHAHIVLGADLANATRGSRLTLEVDGEAHPFTPSGNGGNSATTAWLNASHLMRIASRSWAVAGLLDGYLSHFALVTGAKLSASTFGKRHPRTGQWRPKSKAAIRAAVKAAGSAVRNGWGTNGFFLPFDDTSSTTALGYDRSQSDGDTTGNNWTPANISLTVGATYDSMLDTPTNNFCTLNPIAKFAASGNVAWGSLYFDNLTLNTYPAIGGTMFFATGKWYWEATVAGSLPFNTTIGASPQQNFTTNYHALSGAIGYTSDTGAITVGGTTVATGASYTLGDVIGMALDCDAGTLAFHKNGVLQATVSGISGAALTPAGNVNYYVSTSIRFNFGQQPFSYAPPAGFKSLCTKNLPITPKSGIIKPSSSFVSATDSGANIVSALSALSPWSNWIRIYKRRDAAEGWRWQFSDDAANCLDSSSATAKFAFPTLSGTSYVGHAIRVAPEAGVATGRLAHVNGAADVVADGLANARKMVVLINEAGSNWFAYHPDASAGKLLYLNTNGVETTDASISSVTSSGFTVAATLPTGTYRWIAFAEVEGFLKLGKYASNAAADGPFANMSLLPAMVVVKALTQTTADWSMLDLKRSPYNVARNRMDLNGTNQEAASDYLDFVASGVKNRSAHPNYNFSGSYVYLAFAAFPFRYANAH